MDMRRKVENPLQAARGDAETSTAPDELERLHQILERQLRRRVLVPTRRSSLTRERETAAESTN
jgi:hypothetical protein